MGTHNVTILSPLPPRLSPSVQFSLYISPPHVGKHVALSRQRITTKNKARLTSWKYGPFQLRERARMDTHEQQSTVQMTSPPLCSNEPFPLAGTSNRKNKEKRSSRKKESARGGFEVAPAPPSVYIFGCVWGRACQIFFLFFFCFFFFCLYFLNL